MRTARLRPAVLLIGLMFLWPCAAPAQTQDLAEIQRAAEAYALSQTVRLPGKVEVKAGAIDARSRLSRCESLQPFLAPEVKLWGESNVGVRCLKPETWTVNVPVSVKVTANVVVTARAAGRGQTLTDEDLELQSADLTQLPADVLTDLEDAIGMAPMAALPAGMTLREDMLREPSAVSTGQRVRIVFEGDGFTASSLGRSLGDASVGDTVQVRAASGKILTAVVQEPGVVRVR